MENVYVCSTVYHVMIAAIKSMQKCECDSSIVLLSRDNSLEWIEERLIQSQIFARISLYNEDRMPKIGKGILKYAEFRNSLEGVYRNLNMNAETYYLFNDWNSFGCYLNLKKVSYYLIEDGLNCFKKGGLIEEYYRKWDTWRFKIRMLLGYGCFYWGTSPYTIALEVNDGKDLCINNHLKINVVPRKELFAKLNDTEKEKLIKIFVDETQMSIGEKEESDISTLLLTQPLWQDKLVKSEKIQVELYRRLLEQYGVGTVWIKPHPRDNINYLKYFEKCKVLGPANIPIEILGMLSTVKFSRVVTAFSTAIETLDFCDEKISLRKCEIDEMCKNIEKDLG